MTTTQVGLSRSNAGRDLEVRVASDGADFKGARKNPPGWPLTDLSDQCRRSGSLILLNAACAVLSKLYAAKRSCHFDRTYSCARPNKLLAGLPRVLHIHDSRLAGATGVHNA